MIAASILWAPIAFAQPTSARAREALADAPVDTCFEGETWLGVRVRIALVVHDEGDWALALGPTEPAVGPAALTAARACVRAALVAALPSRLEPAPHRARVHVRTVERADPRLARVRSALRDRASELSACLLRNPPPATRSA